MLEKVRRLSVVLLAVVLAAGLATQGVRAATIGVKMAAAAATDMPMPSKHDGCCDDQTLTGAACAAFCGSIVALPLMQIVFLAIPAEIPRDFAGPDPTGHTVPPDPYPPRPAVLS